MKLWDLRRGDNKPVFVWENLPSMSNHTSVDLNGDESLVMTGTAALKGTFGKLMAFSTKDGS